jgi:hypothetical protein
MTQAEQLAAGWISHFYAADRSIKWGNIEKEHFLWLDEKTLLVGRIDADGYTEDGDFFFADWKTLSPFMVRRIGEVKAEYRLTPQMLTYSIFTQADKCRQFMVRWACKTNPSTYFFEWYNYREEETAWWLNMVKNIAAHIHHDLSKGINPWMTNLTACHSKYGPKFNCPFLGSSCSKQAWDAYPHGSTERGSHLDIERSFQEKAKFGEKMPLVLDATRITTWLQCNERYRREYHSGITGIRPEPVGDYLEVGTDLHDILNLYYNNLKEQQNG